MSRHHSGARAWRQGVTGRIARRPASIDATGQRGCAALPNRYLHERLRNTLSTVAALLCLLQVFSMRWNIVVGGQLLSKSQRGLRSTCEPELVGREGVLMAAALVVVPFVILWVFDRALGAPAR